MIQRVVIVLFAVLVTPALADPKPLVLAGTFGFDVSKPKVKCQAVAGALLAKLNKDYHCAEPAADTTTGSGVKLAASCTAKRGHSEYMLFANAKDCNEERETQLANGAGE